MNIKQTSSIIGLFLLAGILNLHATSASWLGGSSALWATSANWSGSPATVPGTGDTATFNANSANTTIDLGGGVTILNLLFNTGSAAAYTIGTGGAGAETLTLNDSGAITLNSTVASNQLFNAALTLGTATTASYTLANNSPNTLTLAANISGGTGGTTGTKTLTIGGSGNTIFGGNLNKGGAVNINLAKNGSGTFTVNPTSNVGSASGSVTVNAGTLAIDFVNAGANNSLLSSFSPLTLSGGTLKINGNPSSANTQTFGGASFTSGGNIINMVNNGTSPTLTLGAMTWSGYASVEYLTSGASTITTTTKATGPGAIMWNDYDTYGTSDWAVTTTVSSPYTIEGLSSGSGYTTTMGGTGQGVNVDLTANYTTTSGNNGATTVRFNTPTATSINVNGHWQVNNAVLVTPNMGANNCAVGNGNWYAVYNSLAGTEWIWQNNPSGYFGIGSLINNKGGTGALTYVQAGPGTVVMPGTSTTTGAASLSANQFTGQTYLNGGQTVVGVDADLGAPGTGAQVNLNGGTIVAGAITGSGGYPNTVSGGANVTLDNAGSNKRNIVLGNAGGGLAASASSKLTVDGVISSAAGTGPLVIGIPASSANGSTQGLLPGSGSGTANTTSVMATGTVALSGANTYSGGTIIQNAVLNFASGSLGTGGVSIYGGTLQWNANTTDISAQTVTIGTAGATFDVNGNSVSLANSIGNGGSGALTVYSSTGAGSLTLLAGNNYSGGTTVTNGTLVVNNASGSGTGSGAVTLANNGMLGGTGIVGGAVTINSGGIIAPGTTAAGNGTIGTLAVGALTMGSGSVCNFAFNTTPANDTIVVTTSGGLTVNGGVFNLYSAGGTSGWTTPGVHTYYLISYAGSIGGTGLDSTWTNDSPSNPHVANPQSGYSYHFGTNFGYLTVTISQAATLGAWGVNASGNWTVAGNWIGGNVPGVNSGTAGDTATFAGVTTIANYFVNLNANESVGAVTFNQAPSFSITNAANTLTLDNKGVGAVVTVSGGTSNSIQTAVSLNDNTTVTVNSGNSLTISGTISNAPSVIKTLAVNGAGTTILSGANTYGPAAGTVGTTLGGGGTLQVGNAGALGAGDVTNNGNVTLQAGASVSLANNLGIAPAVTVTANNNGNSMALNGVISGSGALTAIGGGILTLGGNNTLTGNLTVNAGTVSISAAVNVASNIVLNGGDLLGSASFYMANNLGIGPTNGATPGTALIDAASGQTFELDGIIASAGNSGANNLTVNSLTANPGTVVLGGNNTFTGTTVIYTNTLLLDNPLALQDSTLNYSSGTLAFTNITAATLAGLSGSSNNLVLTNTAGAAVTLTVGNNNTTAAYAGIVSGSGSLTKVGSGTQTFGTATGGGASYTGQTLNYNGTLVFDGNGSVSMNAGANNIWLDASQGITALNLVDSATVTTSGGVYLSSGGGYPSTSTLTVQNNAVLNSATLSFGNGSRVPGGCSVTVTNNGILNVSGTFNILATVGSTPGNESVNLNGGTLGAGNFVATGLGSGAHANSLNFNGGILKANASDNGTSPLFLPVITDLTAYVNSNGLPFNANGYNVTIGQALVHGNGTPDGGLTVFGGGLLTLTASNSYNGITTISNAVLSVNNTTGSGTGTNVINVLTNGYLGGSGTILGKVTVASYGHTLPGGTNGNATGVMTTVSNITYNAGAEADFNLSNNHSSGNDEVVVNGALAGNGVNIGISPTDFVNTNLDTTADYVLFHVTGSYVSGFNPTPVWLGATPTNSAYYSVVYSGGNVVLHYSPIELLSATVTPNPVTRSQQVTFTVNTVAIPGIDPAVGVYVNAAPIGGSSTLYLVYAGGNSYTNSTTVTTGFGTTNLSYTVTDLSYDSNSGTIPLTINSFTQVWDGLGLDNQWATGTNWVSDLPAGYGDNVTFAGTTQTTPDMESSYTLGSVTFTNGAGAFDITNSANTLTLISGGGVTNLSANGQTLDVPVSVAGQPTFNAAAGNLTLNYPVADDGHGVIFAGTNTTTLAGVNTYTGNTTISAGTLQINGAGQLNSGAYVGNITNNGAFVYDSSASQTLSGGIISGTGSLTMSGSGTLTLGALAVTTTYSGATVVNGGVLGLNAGNHANSGLYLSSGLTINNGGTVMVDVDNSLAGSASTIGSCPVTIYAGGTLTGLSTANVGSGPSTHIRGLLTLAGGTLAMAGTGTGANSLKYGSWDLDVGVVVNGGTNTSTISAPSVMLTQTGGTIFNVTNGLTPSGIDLNVTGTLIQSSAGGATITALIKTGNGTMALSGVNTYTSATTISNGTLRVDGSLAAGSAVTVAGGALGGVGAINGTTAVNADAYLAAGDGGIGLLTFNNNLTLNATSTNRFVVTTAGGASNSVAVTGGTLTPNGSVIEINTAGAANLGAGTNVLFNYSGSTLANAFNLTPVFDTAQTGLATNAYVYDTGSQIQLVVTNPPGALVSSDASLSNLVVNASVSPTFVPGTTNYYATNVNANPTVTVLVTNNSLYATNVLYVNGVSLATNAYTLSNTVPVNVGDNQILVVVTAQDGLTTSNYFVTVTRLPSADPSLSFLALSPAGTLSPTFSSGMTNYTATNANANTSVSVTATNMSGYATNVLFYNGTPEATNVGWLTASVPLTVGAGNVIQVVVTAQDGLTTSTNTVTVTRLASANALLSNLVITPAGTLSPTFASGTTNYNATNTYANKSVTVTATSADGTAALALSFNNGSSYSIPLTTMVASGSQTLGLPTNTVAVRAVSQDLSQTNIYTVNVLLQPSLTVPHLTNSVSGNNLVLSWPADHLGYRLLVQTNNLNKGVSGNTNDWGTVAGTTTLLSTNIAIIKTGVTNEYYKLIYP